MTFEVIADNGNSRTVASRAEAEDVKEDMEGLGMSCEIRQKETDGGKAETHTVAAEKLAEETGEPKETFEAEDKEIPEVDELEQRTDGNGTRGVAGLEPKRGRRAQCYSNYERTV